MTTEEQRPQDAQQPSAAAAETENSRQSAPEQTFVFSTTQPAVDEPPAASPEPVPPAADAPAEPAAAEPVSVVSEASEVVAESAPVAAEQPAPMAGASPIADAPSAEASAPGTAATADAVDPVTAALQTSINTADAGTAGRPSDRLREKLGSRGDEVARASDIARGSEDVKALRPETPAYEGPIDIPAVDDLDASIEEQIKAAIADGTDLAAAAVGPDVPAELQGIVAGASPADAAAGATDAEVGIGSKIKGIVQQIHHDDVFLEAGLRSSLVVSLKQFPDNKPPTVGDEVEVIVDSIDGDSLLRARLPRAKHKASGDWAALAAGQVVDCFVTGINKGGLQVTVSNLKGFLPASQVDVGYVSNLEGFVGQKLTVQVTEVHARKRNLVVSRRILLEAERAEAEGEFWKTLELGQEMDGTVKTIKNYGAFVNLGAIDGFLHIGEMSWSRINHPGDVLKEGQQVQVKILKIDPEKKRVSLGMKQLVQNPWQSASEKYASERIVSGRVSRVADFGAFVELEPGIEGLVHISELAWRRVGSVKEVLSEGETREFKVMEVDTKRKRVSLSLKALEQRPESDRPAPVDEPEPEAVRRRPAPDLRGGMGGQTKGSGLFGNPSDFS